MTLWPGLFIGQLRLRCIERSCYSSAPTWLSKSWSHLLYNFVSRPPWKSWAPLLIKSVLPCFSTYC